MKRLLILALLAAMAAADCYMQNPRGSNDRLNEANTNRNNDNRLFDSQNNAKGGYCLGPSMSYYEGSQLTVEWTNQHGCNNPKLECNIVIQYMCSQQDEADASVQIRDGTTTDTVPATLDGVTARDDNNNLKYGLHEPFAFYQACQRRSRNMGLFIADRQNNIGSRAVNTRQNNGGGQRGLECPEERDYYPYWHPSPWKDIAILTDDTSRCDFYKSQSQNVRDKGICTDPANKLNSGTALPNNEIDCGTAGLNWTMIPSWGIDAPQCLPTPLTRDNHLGNAITGYQASYNWTLPDAGQEKCIKDNNCNCVLRIRYNISTSDTDGWGFTDYTKNAQNSPISGDPYIPLEGEETYNVSLAIDTTQFGRTFQDRSHVFHIRPRPSGVSSLARIFNLNVRGKRGNIVQAYPATEYDFIPEVLNVRRSDYIHFQWTGCDTNPAGNAGEGTQGTDRSNIVQITDIAANYPATEDWIKGNTPLFDSKSLRQTMAYLGQTDCKTLAQLLTDHPNDNNAVETDPNNCMKLNSVSAKYFDGGLIKMNNTGNFYYMSTRNNNFSNRSHKGNINVMNVLPDWAIGVTVVGGVAFLGSAGVGALMFYAKTHPHSAIAAKLSKL